MQKSAELLQMGAAHIYCISVQLLQIDAQHRGHSKFHFKFSILSFFSEKSNLEKYLKISSMENDSAHINLTREIAVKCWWVFSNPNEDLPIKVYWRDIPTEQQTCGRQKNLFNLILILFFWLNLGDKKALLVLSGATLIF